MIIYQHTGLNNSGNHINFMHIFWIEFTVRLLYSQGHRQSWPFRLQKSNNYSCLRKFVVTHTRKNKKTWIKSNQYYNLQTWSFELLKKAGFVRGALEHKRPKLITWTRTWLLLASGVVLQTVIYKGLYGIDRFFLKEIKNVMFLNKIDVPYCLVVFFVVCPRLRPFWSVSVS